MNDLVTLQSIAKELAQSRLHSNRNPADVLFIILVGESLNLNPATSLMNIYNVNGLPSMKADLKLALAKRHPEYAGCTIKGDDKQCTVEMKRKLPSGQIETVISTFTMQDAIRAGLAKKDNWVHYPARMLKARAVSYAVNDLFPDIVFGMLSKEEAEDIEAPKVSHIVENETQIQGYNIPQDVEYEVITENVETVEKETVETEPKEREHTENEIQYVKDHITEIMRRLADEKIDGYESEERRKRSVREHLGVDYIRDARDFDALIKYQNYLTEKLKKVKNKTLAERKTVLLMELGKLPNSEEKEQWIRRVFSALRNSTLDDVEKWIETKKQENINGGSNETN